MSYALQLTSLTFAFLFAGAFAQCPNGYTLHLNNCYQYVADVLPRLKAEEQCQQDNGYLASIHSKAENDFIVTLAKSAPIWIGLVADVQNYVWSDNSAFDYYNWYKGFPNLDYGNCVVLLPTAQYSYEWINGNCPDSKPFVCKTTPGAHESTVAPTSGPNTCPMPNKFFSSGTIQSPGYPTQYGNNLNCTYHLRVPVGNTITIQFSSDFSTELCCDSVFIFDGADSHAKLLARLSGKNGANKVITSTTNLVFITFITDQTNTDKGWSANFSASALAGKCPDGSSVYGPCVSGLCPVGYACTTASNNCCPTTGVCPNGGAPTVDCTAGLCPLYQVCNTATNKCCSTTGISTTPSPGNCGAGWNYDPMTQYCYRLYKTENTWNVASSTCESIGAELVSIHSAGENDYVMNNVIASHLGSFDYFVWSGLNTFSGQLAWSDNSPVNYINWLPGEPNLNSNQCMVLQSWNPVGWKMTQCSVTAALPFICKKPASH
uniref:Uncharacterized protein n=1 Tax=Plectus sambesii TaxID=2011161 RepID=A0A914W9P9_9BILA